MQQTSKKSVDISFKGVVRKIATWLGIEKTKKLELSSFRPNISKIISMKQT